MTYEKFLKILLSLQKENRTIKTLYDNGVDLINFVDPYHKIINELRYNSDSDLIFERIEKYDSDGHNVKSNFKYYVEGEIVREIKAKTVNDKKGNWTSLKMGPYTFTREIKY